MRSPSAEEWFRDTPIATSSMALGAMRARTVTGTLAHAGASDLDALSIPRRVGNFNPGIRADARHPQSRAHIVLVRRPRPRARQSPG